MYFPKNKIRTGLYANDGEFIYLDDSSSFSGYYYSLYNGTFFEGKSPTKGNREIIKIIFSKNNEIVKSSIRPIDEFGWNGQIASTANNGSFVKEALIISTGQIQNVPISSYRSPLSTDYSIGQFIRYFCRKVNEPVFLEINKSTYNALYNQNENWVNLYIPFQMYWLIAGDYQQVIKTNKINSIKKEQTLQVYGFTQYIEKNGGYDKYYF
jgi:hypothetical protein